MRSSPTIHHQKVCGFPNSPISLPRWPKTKTMSSQNFTKQHFSIYAWACNTLIFINLVHLDGSQSLIKMTFLQLNPWRTRLNWTRGWTGTANPWLEAARPLLLAFDHQLSFLFLTWLRLFSLPPPLLSDCVWNIKVLIFVQQQQQQTNK